MCARSTQILLDQVLALCAPHRDVKMFVGLMLSRPTIPTTRVRNNNQPTPRTVRHMCSRIRVRAFFVTFCIRFGNQEDHMMEILRCGHVLYVTQHSTQRVLTATAWARTCRFSQHEGATNGDTAPHRLQPLTVHDAIPPTREAANEVARNAQERASLDRECARDLVVRERVAMEGQGRRARAGPRVAT